MLECVINVSEGRDRQLIDLLATAAGAALLDVHTDPHHHRSVWTVIGEEPARAVVAAAVRRLDLRDHEGAHPRLGVADVIPFVPLSSHGLADAIDARDRLALWLGDELGVPCFVYGPERTLPDVRRHAFTALRPDRGPSYPHPTAGASAVGARPALVAYNVWLARADVDVARRIAGDVRGPALRALGFVGRRSSAGVDEPASPEALGPADAFDASRGRPVAGAQVSGAELVGLLPASVLAATPTDRWAELDLAPERTIEARLEHAGLA